MWLAWKKTTKKRNHDNNVVSNWFVYMNVWSLSPCVCVSLYISVYFCWGPHLKFLLQTFTCTQQNHELNWIEWNAPATYLFSMEDHKWVHLHDIVFFSSKECKNGIPCSVVAATTALVSVALKNCGFKRKNEPPSNVSTKALWVSKRTTCHYICWYNDGSYYVIVCMCACVCIAVDSIELKCTYLSAWTVMYTKYYIYCLNECVPCVCVCVCAWKYMSWHNPLWCEYIFFVSCLHCECHTHMYCVAVCNMLNTQSIHTHRTHQLLSSIFFINTITISRTSIQTPTPRTHTHTRSLSVSLSLSLSYYSCWLNITQVYWICQLEFVIYHDQIISKSIAIQISALQTSETAIKGIKATAKGTGTGTLKGIT